MPCAAACVAGSGGQLRLLRAAAGLADGQPVDLADLTAGVDRQELTLLLPRWPTPRAATSTAPPPPTSTGLRDGGPLLGPVVGWPLRD